MYTDILSGYGDPNQRALFDAVAPTTKEVLNRAITGQQGNTGQTQQQPTGEPGAVVRGQPGQVPGDGGGNQAPTTTPAGTQQVTTERGGNEAQQASGKAEANGAQAFFVN